MNEKQTPESLAVQKTDYVTSAVKASLGLVPFAGSLLAEIAGTVIPNQRVDRLTKFAIVLEQRLSGLQESFVRAGLNNEHFTDLLEEGIRQAARSLSNERRQYIANLIANSLSSDDIEFVESKHLLRLLGEINDIEVIWLKHYDHRRHLGSADLGPLWEKHEAVLTPVLASMGDSQSILDKQTLQTSYKDHLTQLGLFEPRYRIDERTDLPKLNFQRIFEVEGYNITDLGRLLVRQIDEAEIQNAASFP